MWCDMVSQHQDIGFRAMGLWAVGSAEFSGKECLGGLFFCKGGVLMKCPFCHVDDDKVVDSRSVGEGEAIRRRRECQGCGKRFTTYERMERMPLRVVKKDGKRDAFDRKKLLMGMMKACEKRPVSTATLEEEALRIENQLYGLYDREAPTTAIGELIMKRLRELDEVAYIRFASVYREFKDASEFVQEATPMIKTPGPSSDPP